MKKYLIFIITLFLCFTFACKKEKTSVTEPTNNKTINSYFDNSYAYRLNKLNSTYVTIYPKKSYIDYIYQFSDKYTNILVDEIDKNIVYSPINIYVYLSALSEASSGNTKEELINALGTDGDLKTYLQYLISDINYGDENGLLKMANGLWFNRKYTVKEEFLDVFSKYYYGEAFATDFSSQAKDVMANWVNDNTGNMFKLSGDDFGKFNETSQIAYINTLYVKAKWANEFKEHNNYVGIFKDYDGNNKEVAFMKKSEQALYQETDEYEALTVKLSVGSVEFVLPKADLKVSDLCKDNTIYNVLKNKPDRTLDKYSVIFAMPKIDYNNELILNDQFEKLGVTSIFEDSNELNMVNESNYCFDMLVQEAGVIFNEEGVEAASYVVEKTIAPEPTELPHIINFTLDRPFMFIIKSEYNVPLYIGLIVNL